MVVVPTGGGMYSIVPTNQSAISAIAVDGTGVVYAANPVDSTVARLDTFALLASNQPNPRGITTDNVNVYWTNYDGGTVMRSPIGGSGASQIAKGANKPLAIVTDGAWVYWANANAIVKVPVGGADGSTVLAPGQSPVGIAVDATSVYWTNAGDGTVRKINK